MEKKILKTLLFSFLMIVPLMVFSADEPETRLKGKTVTGEVKRLGNGVVWSWVEYGSEGTPVAIGVTLTETALSGLPEKPPSCEKPGYYPVAYSIKYDAARREYTVSLDGLTRR